MKRDSAIVAAIVLIYTSLVKWLEFKGVINLDGINDIIALVLVAVIALLLLVWHDPEVNDE